MHIPSHLLLRPSGYTFRLVVPRALRPFLGKGEIRHTLQTGSEYVAAQMAMRLWAYYQQKFEDIKMGRSRSSIPDLPADVRQLIVRSVTVSRGDKSIEIGEAQVDNENDRLLLKQLIEDAFISAPDTTTPATVPLPGPAELVARPRATPASKRTYLSTLSKQFVDLKKRKNISAEQVDKYQHSISTLIEIIGDKDINIVGSDDLQKYKETLIQIPAHRGNSKMYAGKNVFECIELAKQHNKPPIELSTADYQIQKIAGFFDWAALNLYLIRPNIFSEQTNLSRAERTQNGIIIEFSDDELIKIFNESSYSKIKDPSIYWMPLISLFCSLRLGEISQLETTDIKIIQGIPTFEIKRKGRSDNKLKTESANRIVPIHSQLLNIGFMSYVSDIQKSEYTKLFPHIFPSASGSISSDPSKYFARHLDKNIGITEEGKVFHSFRHNSNDCMKQRGVSLELRCEISGHVLKNVNHEVYTNEARIGLKQSAIEATVYPFLNFSNIRYKENQFLDYIKDSIIAKNKRREQQQIRKMQLIDIAQKKAEKNKPQKLQPTPVAKLN